MVPTSQHIVKPRAPQADDLSDYVAVISEGAAVLSHRKGEGSHDRPASTVALHRRREFDPPLLLTDDRRTYVPPRRTARRPACMFAG